MDLVAQSSIFTCNEGVESRCSCLWKRDRCNLTVIQTPREERVGKMFFSSISMPAFAEDVVFLLLFFLPMGPDKWANPPIFRFWQMCSLASATIV